MAYLVLASALYLALASLLFGARHGDYSHVRDTLSELGELGARTQRAVSWGVFLPVALAMCAAASALWQRSLAASALAGSLALGYLGAALFPCDPGAPLLGSRSQGLHTLAGAIQYAGALGALSALFAARQDAAYLAAAALVAVAVAGLSSPALGRVRGLLQRAGETAAFGALFYALYG